LSDLGQRLSNNPSANYPMTTAAISAEYPQDAPPKGRDKTRLRTLADVDRRTLAGKAAFRLRDDLAGDLGGWDRLSAMQRELVENVAILGAMLKDAAATYLSGGAVDLAEFMALTNAQRRLLSDLGLERRMRDVAPSLDAYLAGKRASA
jgi:hypothetical protein